MVLVEFMATLAPAAVVVLVKDMAKVVSAAAVVVAEVVSAAAEVMFTVAKGTLASTSYC